MRIFLFLLCFLGTLYSDPLEDYLKELIAMQTVTNAPEKNKEALDWVKVQLKELPLYFKEETFNGHPTLLITTRETKTPDLWLVAHIDVVPASASLFIPRVEKGILYGRGAYDMKMAIACYLLLMQELPSPLERYNIGIMLTSDEEVGGKNGVGSLLNQGYGSKVALLPDGGFDWKFEEQAKGVLHVKFQADGVSAHSSRPWEGKNAILMLNEALQSTESYFKEQEKRYGSYYPTFNIGTIQGGEAVNQVPGHAEAKIDIRFPPSTSADSLFKELQEQIARFPGVTVEKIISAPPSQVDLQLPYFKSFKEIAKKIYSISIGTTRSHGASDARYFGEKGIPVLVIAPKGGEIHSEDEWIDLNDLKRFYTVMKQWVLDLTLEDRIQ